MNSVRRSGIRGLEIVVVDDGSTDDSRGVVAGLGGDIRYLYQANRGPAAARNTGIRFSRGRYIAFLDSDDRWLPGGHQRLIEFLETHPNVVVGFADVLVGTPASGYWSLVERFGEEAFRRLPCREETGGFRVLERRAFSRRVAMKRSPVCVDSVVARRAALEEAGGFDEKLAAGEDWDLWLRLAARHTFVYYQRAVAVYEKHSGGLTANRAAVECCIDTVLLKHVRAGLALTPEHQAAVQAHLAERLLEAAYTAVHRGDLMTARERSAMCLRLRGPHPLALLYWCCSWLRPADVRLLRRLKAHAAATWRAATGRRSAP